MQEMTREIQEIPQSLRTKERFKKPLDVFDALVRTCLRPIPFEPGKANAGALVEYFLIDRSLGKIATVTLRKEDEKTTIMEWFSGPKLDDEAPAVRKARERQRREPSDSGTLTEIPYMDLRKEKIDLARLLKHLFDVRLKQELDLEQQTDESNRQPAGTSRETSSTGSGRKRGPLEYTIELAAFVKLIMEEEGVSQRNACDQAGIDPKTFRRYRSEPDTLKKLECLKQDPDPHKRLEEIHHRKGGGI
jgi:hypothetical protein